MSEIRDKVKSRIFDILLFDLHSRAQRVNLILSISEVAIVNREAKPNVEWTAIDDVSLATQIKIGEAFSKAYAGWVKEIKE